MASNAGLGGGKIRQSQNLQDLQLVRRNERDDCAFVWVICVSAQESLLWPHCLPSMLWEMQVLNQPLLLGV